MLDVSEITLRKIVEMRQWFTQEHITKDECQKDKKIKVLFLTTVMLFYVAILFLYCFDSYTSRSMKN